MHSRSGWSLGRFAASPATNLVPGVTVRGVNLGPKPTHGATGHTYRDLFAEWDWAGWIKPQIDAAHSVGANTVRLIGDLEGVNDGTFTQATYNSRWSQLITYAASLGMYAYPAGGGLSQMTTAGLTVAQAGATVAAAAANWDTYPTVIGIDVVQEAVRAFPSNSAVMVDPAPLFAPVRAATTKPLTVSNALTDATRAANPRWRRILDPLVDFWDLHVYFGAPPDYLSDTMWGRGVSKPILIGEFGLAATEGAAAQTARFQQALALMRPGLRGVKPAGALVWTAFDQGTGSGAFGMFNTDGTPRTWMTDVFKQFPT